MTSVAETAQTTVWRDSRAVALLMAATLTVMPNATISPALPGLQRLFADESHAAMLTRLLVPAPSLSIALLAPLAGLAVDRFGRRSLLLAGILLFVVSGSAGLYLPDLPTIFVSRIVLGIAVAFIMTAQTALIGDYFTGETRTALTGLQISARNFGGLVFILLAGSVAAISPRLAFGVYGLAVLVLPLTWLAIVEPRRTSPRQQVGQETLTGEQGRWRLPFLGLVALQSITNMFFFIMPTQLPFFLEDQGYDSAALTGLTLSGLMLTGGCLALLYARIQRAIHYAGVFALGYAAMAAGLIVGPPGGRLHHTWRQIADARLLAAATLAGLDEDHAGEEAVSEHSLAERLVVVVGDRRAEDHQTGLVDDAGRFLARFAPHRKHAVGGRVHRQQRAENVLVPGVLGFVDRLEHAVDFVGLEQHTRLQKERILDSLAAGEPLAQTWRQTHLVENAGVDLPRPVFAGRRMRQAQQVDVRAVVAGVADLAAGQHGLQRQRSAERQRRVGVRGGRQAMVHHLGDEAGHAEHRLRQWPGIRISKRRIRRWLRDAVANHSG